MRGQHIQRGTSHARTILAIAGAVSLLFSGGCGIGGSAGDDTIKVGILAPLSGTLAEDGSAYAKAAKAALREAEGGGGRRIEVVTYDEASETSEAVTGTRRLIQKDQVDALLSGSTSGNFLATRQLIDKAQIPVVTIATATTVVKENAGWTFRISQPLPDRIDDNVKFATDKLNAKSVAFLQVNDESQRAFAKEVSRKLSAQGVNVVSNQYFQYGDTDFSPYIQQLRSRAPNVTFLGCEVTQCATILEQAHASGVNTDFVLPTAASSEKFLESFGDVGEGAFVQTIYAPGAVKATAQFEQLAEKKAFPKSYYSAIGYAEGAVLAEALKKAGSVDSEAIRKALAEGRFDTPLGRIHFLDNGQAKVPGYVARVSGSKYVHSWAPA